MVIIIIINIIIMTTNCNIAIDTTIITVKGQVASIL